MAKYLERKTVSRPREKDRIGWKVWSCGDNASEINSGVMSQKTDKSVLFGVVRRTISGTECNSTDFGNFCNFGKNFGNFGKK